MHSILRIVPIALLPPFAKLSLSLSLPRAEQLARPEGGVRDADRQTHTCSRDEDRKLAVERFSDDSEWAAPQSFGFLLLAYGSAAEGEAELSMGCLRAAFGAGVNITLARPREGTLEGCSGGLKDQHGSCFIALMGEKIRAAIDSPYDVTVMLDTDVFANPTFALKEQVIPTLRSMFKLWDVVFAEAFTQYTGDLTTGTYNAGFVAFRRSPATDRFFNCVLKKMRDDTVNEQVAYATLLQSPRMMSVRSTVLPENWQCRFADKPGGNVTTNLGYRAHTTHACIFSHKHFERSQVQKLCGAARSRA